MNLTKKDLERGEKYLKAFYNVQERQIKSIKSIESVLKLGYAIIENATKALEVRFPYLLENKLNELKASEEEIEALKEAFNKKYQILHKQEYDTDLAKANELWEQERPELEKEGLVTEFLKNGAYYYANFHGHGSKKLIKFEIPMCGDNPEIRYWNSSRSKKSYILNQRIEHCYHGENFKRAKRDIGLIKMHKIKPGPKTSINMY